MKLFDHFIVKLILDVEISMAVKIRVKDVWFITLSATLRKEHTRVYPKVSGLATCCEN
jgi:hypothetical protein